jgi:hypothetical protein
VSQPFLFNAEKAYPGELLFDLAIVFTAHVFVEECQRVVID